MSAALERLEAVILSRRGADPESSHTARMLAKGPEKCARKFAEEAVELVLAAAKEAVAKQLEGATIVKEIVVPGRLVNFVTK